MNDGRHSYVTYNNLLLICQKWSHKPSLVDLSSSLMVLDTVRSFYTVSAPLASIMPGTILLYVTYSYTTTTPVASRNIPSCTEYHSGCQALFSYGLYSYLEHTLGVRTYFHICLLFLYWRHL